MKVLNLNQSLDVVSAIRTQLSSLVDPERTQITIAYSEPRAKPIIDLLGDNIQGSQEGIACDLFLSLDDDFSRANELDLPLIEYDLQETILAWEREDEVRKEKYIHNLVPVVSSLLSTIEPNSEREGLCETPQRVAKAWAKWTEGYSIDIKSLLKVFEDGAEKCDEMVIVKDIPIYSKCEHHLADIFGTATIAYIPNGRIVGLSKLSRLADAFSRRLQVQERLTNQIADALEEHLNPLGVGVVIRARHMCMESRGLCQQGHHTITSALRGNIKDNTDTRAEFMALANSSISL